MPTKGSFGLCKNGVTKATYSHRESYPSVLGKQVVDFCRAFSIDELNKVFDEIVLVDENDKMTELQIQAYKKYLAKEYWNENLDWYTVLKYSNDITKPLIDGFRYMVEYGSFIGSMRCRWIYIINLDANKLEIYKNGLEKIGISTDVAPEQYKTDDALIPLLVGDFTLDTITNNWLEIVTKI